MLHTNVKLTPKNMT